MRLRICVAAAAACCLLAVGLPGAAQTSGAGAVPPAAQPNAKSEALVRRYFAAIKFESLMDALLKSMIPMMTDSVAQQYPSLTAEQRKVIGDAVREAMRDKVLPDMVDRIVPVYAATFSESELEAMVAFYESPAGRAVTDKAPALAPKVTEVTKALIPEMQRETLARVCAKIDCTQKKPAAKPRAS